MRDWVLPSTSPLSIVNGLPLSEEPGLGATLTLPAFLREVTTRYADREALVLRTPASVERWSYATLWERAMEVARALVACGIVKDSRVGVMMTNRPEFLAAVFGVSLAGGVAVTISTFSTPSELEYLLQISSVSVLLAEREVAKKDFTEILRDLEPESRTAKPGMLASTKFPFLRYLAVVGEAPEGGAIEGWSQFLARGNATPLAIVEARAAGIKPSDPAVVFFSSGSTARPKGVLHSHRALAITCTRWRWVFALGDDVRCWTANGFFWSGNFGMAICATLSSGGSLVLQRMFDPEEALQLMQDERVTLPHAWPHQWAQIEAAANFSKVNLSSLHYVGSTRAAVKHPSVSTDWVEPMWAYGNTETFTISTIFPANTPAEITGNSHGVPLPGNTLKIVDPLTGKTVLRGERGEIGIKGPTLMLGYLGIPLDETLDEEGFLRTGDGGYVDDKGRLFWEGRLTDIVKTGGANVSPMEIDTALAGYPGIKFTQTVGVPHDTLGEIVITCAVAHEGSKVDEGAVREFLKKTLAAYKVPRRVMFFQEDELALTGSSKIKSSALRELVAKRLAAHSVD